MERAFEPGESHGQEEPERVSLSEVRLRLRQRIGSTLHLRRELPVQGGLPLRERLRVRYDEVASTSRLDRGCVDLRASLTGPSAVVSRHVCVDCSSDED